MSTAQQNGPREFQFPSKIGEAWEQKEQIEKEIRALEKRKKALEKFMKDQLQVKLPDEPDEDGHYVAVEENVKLTGYYQDYPSYSKALREIINELVPKTKQYEAGSIISSYTNTKFNTKLSWVEPEEDYGNV
jgi:hypothetical protein